MSADKILKAAIAKELTPFLDSLTDEELIVFKKMCKNMKMSLDQDDDS